MRMTRKAFLPAALGAALLFGAGAAEANEGSKSKVDEQASQQAGAQQEVMLTVTEVDQQNNKVQFEANIDPTAQVQKGSETIAVSDLQPGDQVRASFDPNTGEVQSLEVIEGGQQQPGMEPSMPERPAEPMEPSEPGQEPGMGGY